MDALSSLREKLNDAEGILVTSDVNRRYLSHFSSSAGAVLLTSACAILFLDFRYREMGERAHAAGVIPKEFTFEDAFTVSRLKEVCRKLSLKHLYYEDRRMTCAEFSSLQGAMPEIEFTPAGDRIERLRAVKTPEELARIRASQSLTEEAYLHVLDCFSPSATEAALAAEIDCYFRRHGAENAFETILISGTRTSLPHGTPTTEPLCRNSFVTMDFGAKVDGYCADMTRTVVFGRADEEMRALYEVVQKAQDAAFSRIRAGVPGKEVDAAARSVIDMAGYRGCFEHSTGHSLGLEIHEGPNFAPKEERAIPAGAVVSVEPGVYLAGKYGVRIEDIVFVTENGYENLTHAKKDFTEVG